MPRLKTSKRSRLPDRAFAYIDSRGRRRLPVHDKAHVRNALARFNQVAFEDDAARERARTRLLNAAKKYGIVPVGFITGQLQSERRHATAGRLVIELGRNAAPGELEQRLRTVLRDPTLAVLHWSDAYGAYLDAPRKVVQLPDAGRRPRERAAARPTRAPMSSSPFSRGPPPPSKRPSRSSVSSRAASGPAISPTVFRSASVSGSTAAARH